MVKINIADIRQEYTKGGLRENELPGDPLSLFSRWLQEAIDAEVDEPTAVIVGTVSPEGKPSTRTVLLKVMTGSLSSTLIMKAVRENSWNRIHISRSLLSGTLSKDRYT